MSFRCCFLFFFYFCSSECWWFNVAITSSWCWWPCASRVLGSLVWTLPCDPPRRSWTRKAIRWKTEVLQIEYRRKPINRNPIWDPEHPNYHDIHQGREERYDYWRCWESYTRCEHREIPVDDSRFLSNILSSPCSSSPPISFTLYVHKWCWHTSASPTIKMLAFGRPNELFCNSFSNVWFQSLTPRLNNLLLQPNKILPF